MESDQSQKKPKQELIQQPPESSWLVKYRDGKYGWHRVTVGKTRFVWEGFGRLLGHSCTTLYFGLVAALLRSLCLLFDSFCVAFLVTFVLFSSQLAF